MREIWPISSLGELVTFYGGVGFPEHLQGNASGEIPFFKVSDMSRKGNARFLETANNYVSESLARSLSWRTAPANSVVFAKVGAALLLNRRRQLVRQSLLDNNMTAASANSAVSNDWIYWQLQLVDFADFVQVGALPSVNQQQLSVIEIPTPCRVEQKAVAQILDTLDTQIQKTEALIAKLEKIKEGLLHDLLTRGIDQNGQLRPTPEQTPELYKESALGLIPKRWEVRSIAESGVKLIDGDRGANYPSDQDFTTGSGYCIFLSAKNVTRSGFRFDTRQFISKDKDRVLGTGKLVRNDVIVTTRGTVGNFAHYSHSIPYNNIRINSGMLILRGAESNLIPEFLYLSLKEHLFHRENGKKGSGSAQPQLPARDFESFRLVIPDQEEQQKIIELASVQNQRIKAENDEIQKLTSLKAALMDDLLTGRVRVTPLLANS